MTDPIDTDPDASAPPSGSSNETLLRTVRPALVRGHPVASFLAAVLLVGGMVVIILSLTAHAFARPFKDPWVDATELVSLWSITNWSLQGPYISLILFRSRRRDAVETT